MAIIEVAPRPGEQDAKEKHIPTRSSSGHQASWWMMWGCLFCTCIGVVWFSYQYFLVPQPQSFAPNWHTAHWIQASDGTAPVAYFRSAVTLAGIPDEGLVTIGANQTFRLYVNQTFIGSNETDFLSGSTMRPYVYDITSALIVGPNLIVVRVANLDKHTPVLRAALHFTSGAFGSDDDTGVQWQATTNSGRVFPRLQVGMPTWDPLDFGSHPWPVAQILANGPALFPLPVDPALYQRPLPRQWMTAGPQTQGYYLCQLQVTNPLKNAWVRFAATGPAEIFVNGNPVVYWEGTPINAKTTVNALSRQYANVKVRTPYMVGMYDLAPYMHTGQNTLAVYVSSANSAILLAQAGGSLSLEVMLRNEEGQDIWVTSPSAWHVSGSFAEGWQQGSSTALAWPAPVQVARPLSYKAFYMPDSNALQSSTPSLRDQQSAPILLIVMVMLASVGVVLTLWLLMVFMLGRRYYGSLRNGMIVMSLAFLPALALEVLLVLLAREPHLLQPFPYNAFWGLVLIVFVVVTYLFLWLHAFLRNSSLTYPSPAALVSTLRGWWLRLPLWFRRHWPVLLLVIVGIALVFPSLHYEPYWQDELITYYVAKNSILRGLPQHDTGFIYPKGELFHYILGVIVVILGDQNGIPRLLSAVEYIAAIVLLYYVGMRFFNRRVGWLAAAMLTFSPYALISGAQERMYQQAQLGVLLTFFVFYIAVRKPKSVYWPYIAVGCLLMTYLSHEEIFIVLPALLLGVLLISKSAKRVLPSVFYQKHWWFAALLGVCAIACQLLIVKLTHPPVLGTDHSSRPNVQLNEDGIGFYYQFFFAPSLLKPWMTVNSVLAVVGCIYALRGRNKRLKYSAVFLVLSTLMLVFVFTLRADRYFYPILCIFYLLGAYALSRILQSIWHFAYVHIVFARRESEMSTPVKRLVSPPLRWVALLSGGLVCGAVIVGPILPITNNSLTGSRLIGGSYYQHFADYDVVGQYIKQHQRPGDIIISISPDIEMIYYAGHSDYFISIDRALFLMEKNGHISNTATGATALLNQQDLDAVLAQHPRVWLVSDHGGYEVSALRRFTIPNGFRIVCEGARTVLYLRGD